MWTTIKLVSVFVLLGIPGGVVVILWALLTRNTVPMYRTGQWIAAAGLRAAGIRVEGSGREHIPADRACIFLANHISNLDPPVLVPLLPGTPSIMMKAALFKIPLLGTACRIARYVPVEREGGREAAVRSARMAADVIRSGLSMVIFAEGTRSRNGRLQPFKAGPFHLAQSTGAPIVPIAISGTESMMRKGSANVYPGVARVQFLPPVYPSEYLNRAEMMATVHGAIAAVLPENMRPLPAAQRVESNEG